MNERQLIALVAAINECVDIDEYAIEDIAHMMNMNSSQVVMLLEEIVQLNTEYEEIDFGDNNDLL